MNGLKTSYSQKLKRFWAALLDIFGPKKVAVFCFAILTVMMLALTFSVRSCSGVGDSGEQNTDPLVSERKTVTSKVTGEQLPKTASGLKKQTDRIAASYDYDKALALVAEYEAAYENAEDCSAYKQELEAMKSGCVRWEDTTHVPHIFFHSLIADTDRAFDGDEDTDGYNLYMTTISEFNAIMEQMYTRGYVLVDIHDMIKQVKTEDGKTVYQQGDIYLPEGKKPFVLSVDDVNYYKYMTDGDGDGYADEKSDGFAHKLVIGKDGKVTNEYYEKDGTLVTGSYDVLPLLEDFIEKYPDFSYRGARGILGVTGYEGVFGYHTHPDWKNKLSAEEYNKEVEQAKAVSEAIKKQGWVIASHSYAHFGYGSCTAANLASDVYKWEEQVQPIVGDTDVLIYPFGEDIAGVEEYQGAKYQSMRDAGFRIFCNVDASADYWVQIHDGYMRQGRINLDGYRLYHSPNLIKNLIDAKTVIDSARPTPVPSL